MNSVDDGIILNFLVILNSSAFEKLVLAIRLVALIFIGDLFWYGSRISFLCCGS